MIFGDLIHPELIGALASAGHGATVLLADGNYPVSTRTHPRAAQVHLNLTPGLLDVTQVLRVIQTSTPIEQASVMVPEDGRLVEAHREYRTILGDQLPWREFGRDDFYQRCVEPDLAVAVATGDQRTYANLLLTVGVREPDE